MRLTKIKLAGFKSFVDPTTFHIPSNLVGIVGPNGCGKSNLIDAVRWVMGESSARSLRGESMADVIFNGSAARKPVGQASIELVFDNSQGRLGGAWARYSEIAIKRLLSRDGQAYYFLNGVRCRRRDITDIFLGTGLGPRSYAIIEQGMISRLIDAKPDELRVFLEEAAGISKYKERRRETETRIRHTRENLERLNDLREELARQLQHLQRQTKLAEQYQRYRAEERRLKAELLAMRWRALERESTVRERSIREQETALEATLAEQRRLEARLEAGREQQLGLNLAFNQAQEHCYGLGSEIARLEQSIEHQRELKRRQQEELRRTEQTLTQLIEQSRSDQNQSEALQASLGETETALRQARVEESEAGDRLAQAEAALRDWQESWEEFSRRSAEPQRRLEVERTRMIHLERQLQQLQQRTERLQLERETLNPNGLEEELAQLSSTERLIESALLEKDAELARIDSRLAELREARQQATAESNALRERVQSGLGRLASLRTLQEAVLGQRQGAVSDWLAAQSLSAAPRLAEQLGVEAGWEPAVETVLAGYLEAVCVTDLEAPAAALAELENGRLVLVDMALAAAPAAPGHTLSSKVQAAPWSLGGLLAGVRLSADLDEALSRRRQLAEGESLITPEGAWIGRNWLRVARGNDETTGVLAREREIRLLEAELDRDGQILSDLSGRLERSQGELHEFERNRSALQEALTQAHREQARVQGQVNVASHRLQQMLARRAALDEELEESQRQMAHDRSELQQARTHLEEAALALEKLAKENQILITRRDELRKALEERRSAAAKTRQAAQQQALRVEALGTRRAATRQALERLQGQRDQLNERCRELSAVLAAPDEPLAQERLQALLTVRVQAEQRLAQARQTLAEKNGELHSLERARSVCQAQLQEMTKALEAERLAWREIAVHRQTTAEQLQALGADRDALLAGLPPDPDEPSWQAKLEQVVQRIQRLGAVNLAAIDECALLTERKGYLDAQNDDLMEALATLEQAMRKIDRETRSRFKATFEQVNGNLQVLFPRLFGGGRAYLELVGEDPLDAGVAIMAQPPGKRIGTIYLLSGGEKALTAVALIFAFFQLNPAPFCLLDEVDAPLDEANIGRFGELVTEMSERVQFIFITHNKGTMEIARHLSGVTMHEPGVSRLVAVDVEEAMRLAAAG